MKKLSRIFASLALLAAATTAATSASAEDRKTLEIGYMPILPVSQVFVALEEGWIADAGVTPKLIRFQNGPAMVQALLAGQLDVAHFGIGPAMVARARGANIKAVASSVVEQISVVALGELAPYFEGDHKTAFARFAADKGRRAVITTFPTGSVPETVLQYWLRRQLGVDPKSVDIIFQGAAQVQQALLTGAVDGAAILEPIVSITKSRLKGAKVVASGSELFPSQPGAVLVVREGLIADHPAIVQALVTAHARATDVLRNDPARATAPVAKYVGGGRLDPKIVRAALDNTAKSFVADPHYIIGGTRVMHDFQAEIGTLKKPVNLDELFETRFYDAIPQK